ncbi:MAG: glycosyltransferase family 2 protein [Oceanipulchritudo sp.]
MKISIVVPFHNEAGCAAAVLEELRSVRGAADEIIAVDDGSTDETATIIEGIPGIISIHLAGNQGQSAAVYAGIHAATGDFIFTMDGDGQNDPNDFETLREALDAADFAIGYRLNRMDSWSKRAASRLANGLRSRILNDCVRDSGCGLKAFRRQALKAFIPFNGLHRFMPALAINAGLRVVERPVHHRPRHAGTSKYTNWDRGLRGLYDLIGVSWFLRRAVYPTPSFTKGKHPWTTNS